MTCWRLRKCVGGKEETFVSDVVIGKFETEGNLRLSGGNHEKLMGNIKFCCEFDTNWQI
jgi:hypothetical protein